MNFKGDLTAKCLLSLEDFTYKDYEFDALVVSVYDGDTCRIVFYESNIPRKYSVRLFGYDSPEIKPSGSIPDREVHIEAAKRCKEFLENLICKKIVKVFVTGNDMYGRPLVKMYYGKYYINELMKSIGCLPYEGKTKEKYTIEGLGKIITNIDKFTTQLS